MTDPTEDVMATRTADAEWRGNLAEGSERLVQDWRKKGSRYRHHLESKKMTSVARP
jgi:hypothetical protein